MILLIIIIVLSVITAYFYFLETMYYSSIVIYVIFIPILLFILYMLYKAIGEQALLNAGGTINIFNYYDLNPVYLQIFDNGKHVWDAYVDVNSVTQYDWAGNTTIRAVASDDPNIINPSTTIYFDITYNVTGADNILMILNADSSYFEQLSSL